MKKEDLAMVAFSAAVIYLVISLIMSVAFVDNDQCDETYPITMIIYSQWFCEIKD